MAWFLFSSRQCHHQLLLATDPQTCRNLITVGQSANVSNEEQLMLDGLELDAKGTCVHPCSTIGGASELRAQIARRDRISLESPVC